MTKILVVEDEVLIAEYLKDTLNSLGFNQVRLAYNKQQAIAAWAAYEPDLALLDIRMEEERDGIAVAEYLAEKGTPFIFITAHSDRDILAEALSAKPEAYLTKPFKKMDVYAAIQLAIGNQKTKKQTFAFKDGHDTIFVPCEDILYIESDGNYVSIVTPGRKHTIRYSLDACLQDLPDGSFKRIHRSYIVNLDQIEKITSKYVVIAGVNIPKSRNIHIDPW